MSNPTTPFGWQMPEATDLVTDLPADFEVFGQAVATDLQYLLGGTTGQVLAKASGTDLDFDWVTDATGMTNPMTTTGDVIYSSPGSTPVRLGIGSDGNVLTVASGVPSWAAPGGKVVQIVAATNNTQASSSSPTFVDTGLTATITPTSASNQVLVFVNQNGLRKNSTDSGNALDINLYRTATNIATFAQGLMQTNTGSVLTISGTSITILDSPATTSATTYKTQFRNQASGSVFVQTGGTVSSIILMEVIP